MNRKPRLTRVLVNRLPAQVEDQGPVDPAMPSDNYYPQMAAQVLARLDDTQPLWVFAIGSLIWNPRFEDVERRTALVQGWRRSFCLGPDTRYRGSPGRPGRMLSLVRDEGGACPGVVIRMRCEDRLCALESLLRKEPPIAPSWVQAETEAGPVQAIAFTVGTESPLYWPEASDEAVADVLANAVGTVGSMADYLLNTVTELDCAGVHDPYIWRMQELVAARLERLSE